jgi:DIM1 family U5 snRNP protein
MSYMLPHLESGWAVDQAIVTEQERVVVIRFGHDSDPDCMLMDETLYKIADEVKNFAVIYVVDTTEVPDFNNMYELWDPLTVMFFYNNRHIMIDLGTGDNNKITWPIEDKQEVIDIVEVVFRYVYSLCLFCASSFSDTSMFTPHITRPPLSPLCSGAVRGRGLVESPKDYSTKYKY